MNVGELLKLIIRKLTAKVLPVNGLTPRYVAGLLTFIVTVIPFDFMVAMKWVLFFTGVVLFLINGEKAMDRFLVIFFLIALSQWFLPDMFRQCWQAPNLSNLGLLGVFLFLDYGLSQATWAQVDNTTPTRPVR